MRREPELQAASLAVERHGDDDAGSETGDLAVQTECGSDAGVGEAEGEDADYCDALRAQMEDEEDGSDGGW